MDRRHFLSLMGAPAVAAAAGNVMFNKPAADFLAQFATDDRTPEEVAKDENYWLPVQQAFMVDRSLVNLNNGGCCPCPTVAQEAMKRYMDYSNTAPVHAMWRILEPEQEGVRKRLARLFKVSPEEIAITRNASEGLQICQLGIDLKRGDEILCNTQDYPRMINTFKQRERREGIKLKQFKIPIPAEDMDEIVALYKKNITSKTKLILVSHMINITGQVMPVKAICKLGRERGIPVIVDGAHTFAHWDFNIADLECDYFATSLHKWLLAPMGTGMLYVRKDKIKDLWPMQPANDTQDDDIRKFEEIGTHPAGNTLAISESITFHNGVGASNKAARLVYLRDRWINALTAHDNVRIHTPMKKGLSYGIGNIEIINPKKSSKDEFFMGKVGQYLWAKHKIISTPIKHPEFEGMRITPNIYTTLEEVDRFIEVMSDIAKKGLPA